MGTSAQLTTLVRTGIELVKLALTASGPDAAALLTANVEPGPCSASPTDSPQQWRMVAHRMVLSPEQRAAVGDWRSRFLQRIKNCYARRMLLRMQMARLPSGDPSGNGSQWAEAVLLQAAEKVGYSGKAVRILRAHTNPVALLAGWLRPTYAQNLAVGLFCRPSPCHPAHSLCAGVRPAGWPGGAAGGECGGGAQHRLCLHGRVVGRPADQGGVGWRLGAGCVEQMM